MRFFVRRCGEVVDLNLIRDKVTGKSCGFAFIAYEDQRSTILAVDNFNGAKVDDDYGFRPYSLVLTRISISYSVD